jgi:hypothetical protein
VEKVGFSQAYSAIEKKRVVRFAGRLSDGHGGGMGECIVAADDEGLEGIFGIEGDFAQERGALVFGRRLLVGSERFFFRAVQPGLFVSSSGRKLGGSDLEGDFQALAGDLGKNIVEEAEIVILQPELTKLV